jgi:hypothetical protein
LFSAGKQQKAQQGRIKGAFHGHSICPYRIKNNAVKAMEMSEKQKIMSTGKII